MKLYKIWQIFPFFLFQDFKLKSSDIAKYGWDIKDYSTPILNNPHQPPYQQHNNQQQDKAYSLHNGWTKSKSSFTILNRRDNPHQLSNICKLSDIMNVSRIRPLNTASRTNSVIKLSSAPAKPNKKRNPKVKKAGAIKQEESEDEKYKGSLLYQLLKQDEDKMRGEDFLDNIPSVSPGSSPTDNMTPFPSRQDNITPFPGPQDIITMFKGPEERTEPLSSPDSDRSSCPPLNIDSIYEDISSQYTMVPEIESYMYPGFSLEYNNAAQDVNNIDENSLYMKQDSVCKNMSHDLLSQECFNIVSRLYASKCNQ